MLNTALQVADGLTGADYLRQRVTGFIDEAAFVVKGAGRLGFVAGAKGGALQCEADGEFEIMGTGGGVDLLHEI